MRTPTALLALPLILAACTGESSAPKGPAQKSTPEAVDKRPEKKPVRKSASRGRPGEALEESGAEKNGALADVKSPKPQTSLRELSSDPGSATRRREGKKFEPAAPPSEPEAKPPGPREPVAQVVTPEFPKAVHEEHESIREKVKLADDAYAAYDEDSEDSARWQAAHAAVKDALEPAVRFQGAHPAYPRIAGEVDELRRKAARLEAERP